MTDTSADIEAMLTDRYRALAPGARLRMATSMFSSGKRMALAGILATDGALSDSALRRKLLDRLYGDELPHEAKDAILARGRG